MRIHTNLTKGQMFDVRRESGAPISLHKLDEHGSATHARSFDVALNGTGGRNNTGLYGAGDRDGATWDEWGAFLGALFDADPEARAGGTSKRPVYANRDHFHYVTGNRFHKRVAIETLDGVRVETGRHTYLPADTHPRHSWDFNGSNFECRKCSATRPGGGIEMTYRHAHQIGA